MQTPRPVRSRIVAGFTLVELMVVVAVLAVLAAVAIPGYQGYVRRARAKEARDVLTAIMAFQDKYFEFRGRYAGPAASAPGTNAGTPEYCPVTRSNLATSTPPYDFPSGCDLQPDFVGLGVPMPQSVWFSYRFASIDSGRGWEAWAIGIPSGRSKGLELYINNTTRRVDEFDRTY